MPDLDEFNSLPAERLTGSLLAVCAAPAWGAAVLAGRPYGSRSELLAAAGDMTLSWDEVLQGLSAHPRIGERAQGDSAEAAWSRQEQSTAARTDAKTELTAANRAYEEKFGHVFLIFATGKTQAEILAAARERLASPVEAEREVVAGELAKIARLRLARLVPFHISTHVLDTVTGNPATGVPVTLSGVGEAVTDADGRARFDAAEAGDYRLAFDVAAYQESFFPSVDVAFRITDTDRNYHVPLLLSRYGYTTYRGS